MAKYTDKTWQKMLAMTDPSDLSETAKPLRDLIATARVSDATAGVEWVLNGILKDGRYISCRATAAGIHACSVSTIREAVESDLQRFGVAARVGLVQRNDMKPAK